MLPANLHIVAQLPPKKPSQRLRPTIRDRIHALRSNSRIRPVDSSRIAFDGTELVLRNEPRVLGEPPEFARGQLLDLPALGLEPAPQPLGQSLRARSQVRAVFLSAATGPRSRGPAR